LLVEVAVESAGDGAGGVVGKVPGAGGGEVEDAVEPTALPAVHAGPPAVRGARRMAAVEVAAWIRAMRARSAPSSVSL
jgi:hypothetical protein